MKKLILGLTLVTAILAAAAAPVLGYSYGYNYYNNAEMSNAYYYNGYYPNAYYGNNYNYNNPFFLSNQYYYPGYYGNTSQYYYPDYYTNNISGTVTINGITYYWTASGNATNYGYYNY